MTLWEWALWGLAGAFAYGGPKLLANLFDPPQQPARPAKAIAFFVFALVMGPIAGAGFGPYLSGTLHLTGAAEWRALAVLSGLVVNPVAPTATDLWTQFVLARLGHPLAERKPEP